MPAVFNKVIIHCCRIFCYLVGPPCDNLVRSLRKNNGSRAYNDTGLEVQHDSVGTFLGCPEDPSSAGECVA